jgi:hypothetical protein
MRTVSIVSIFLVVSLLVTQTLLAQTELRPFPHRGSSPYSFGLIEMDYWFNDIETGILHSFKGTMYGFKGSSTEMSAFTIGYGVVGRELDSGDEADIMMINVKSKLGGNNYLFEDLFSRELNIYLPFRIHLDYHHLGNDLLGNNEVEFFGDDIKTVNNLMATLSYGLGLNYRSDRFFPLLGDKLFFDIHYTFGLGANVNIIDADQILAGGARKSELSLQVNLIELIGPLSIHAGARFMQANFNQETFNYVPDMITDPNIFESDFKTSSFWVGIRYRK